MSTRNRIKELRKEKGLSQKEFAKAFNEFSKDDDDVKSISYATVSRWENGENEPKFATWFTLAAFFNVPISYLMGITNERNISGKTIDEVLARIYDQDSLIYLTLEDTIKPFLNEEETQKLEKKDINPDDIKEFSELIKKLFVLFIDSKAGKDKNALDVYQTVNRLAQNYFFNTYLKNNSHYSK